MGVLKAQRAFNIAQRVADLVPQRFAVCASNEVQIVTLWKVAASTGALPKDQRLDMCCCVVSHT